MAEIWKLYDRMVKWFDETRSKDLMENEYLQLITDHIPKKGKVLDIGCGTAEPIAAYFINRGFHLTGLDGSTEMIALCKKRFPEMEWVVSDMKDINLDRKFHAIIAWDSLFHLNHNDQVKMFPIFEHHLHQDGLLLYTSGSKRGEELSRMNGQDFYHASLGIDEYKALLEENGFDIILNRIEDPNCGQHTVWLVKKR